MSKTACCSKVGMKRGPWTPEEDELLANHVKREGEGRWRTLPKRAGLLRCGKSCRLRWVNYLRPSVKRGHITPDEEDLILRLHRLLGNRWALIAGRIPGRTDNEIKNYWNTHLSKKLIRQGIDPRTHKPLDPNPSPNLNPKPNSSRNVEYSTAAIPNPNFVGKKAEQAGGHHPTSIDSTTGAENSKMIAYNSDQYPNTIDRERIDQSCQRYGGLMMEVESEHGNEEIDMGCANDDTFSSFLNSLINEDVLASQHQQHPSLLGTASSSQSVMQNFNH